MKRRIRIVVVLLLVLGAGAAAAVYTGRDAGMAAAALDALGGTLGSTLGRQAGPAEPETLALHGNVDIREVLLAFSGDQRIEETLVDEGTLVHKGQLLATLDRRHLLAEVARIQAEVDMRRHRLEELEAGNRPASIRAAEARMEAARATYERAAADLERVQSLVARNAASSQQRDTARAEAAVAAADLDEARQLVELAREGPRIEEIAASRSALQASEAELSLARHRLEDAMLYAPAEGVIRNRLLEAGEMAAPDRPVFSLALTNPLWIRAYVDGANLSRVRPGARADVSVGAASGKRYHGWVGFISPTAEFTPRSVQTEELRTHLVYEVRVLVCDPDGDLRLGMPATATIAPPGQDADGAASCEARKLVARKG
ncbi:MAG TPA: efflux RND transporter periplasmic adaptor subunit [Arenibaculum sp.]|nr:efflux RND transporter periplasmic adaptor subunit [Arenibaculum sp.]